MGHLNAPSSGAQRLLESLAGAGQPRHHRADRHARDLADLLVGQPFDLAQHDHLAEFRRPGGRAPAPAFPARRSGAAPPPGARPPPPRCACVSSNSVVERSARCRAARCRPCCARSRAARPARSSRPPRGSLEILERAQTGVLHDVFGVVRVPRQVARQPVGGVQVRQHRRLRIAPARLTPTGPRDVAGSLREEDSAGGEFIPGGISRGGRSLPRRTILPSTLLGGRSRMRSMHADCRARTVAGAPVARPRSPARRPPRHPGTPPASAPSCPSGRSSCRRRPSRPGRSTFTVTNGGSIPHAFEVEGQGTEQETAAHPARRERHADAHAQAGDLRGLLPGRRRTRTRSSAWRPTSRWSAPGARAPRAPAPGRQAMSRCSTMSEPARDASRRSGSPAAGPSSRSSPGRSRFPDSAGADPQAVRRRAARRSSRRSRTVPTRTT